MKNIIFDFGNVLVQWHPEEVYARHFGDEARAWWFLRHVIDAPWRNRIDAGESHEACIAELQAAQPHYAEAIGLYRSRWREMLTGEVPGMSEVVDDLAAQGYRLFGLTNWSMETFPEARERFGILQKIDRYVVSGAEGLVKPDPRLFQVLLDRFGLRAEECLFVDDNETNVQAARSLGMEGIVFGGADDLRNRLHLHRPVTADEVARLQAQGNTADDWSQLRICPGTPLAALHGNHFGAGVSLGLVKHVCRSRIERCRIGDGAEVDDVRLMSGYTVGRDCRLSNIGELCYGLDGEPHIDVMNENGGRRLLPSPDMTVGDAFLYARFRDRHRLTARFDAWGRRHTTGLIGDGTVIRNATALIDGLIGPHCHISHGLIAERFLLGENVHLEAGLRLNDTVVGDNSTLARGEVGCSLIFPAHEQHHNNSFLIAALTCGQSNIAAGATLGSNHNGRTADGELAAGRGFWPALCVSVKHSSRFASYTLLTKADYPSELNITLPFSLVSNNQQKNRLEVMPAYWWLYNMYALNRNRTKFAARDHRALRRQHIEFSPFAPDTAEEMLVGRGLLHLWTTRAYQDGAPTEVQAYGMERGHRKTVVLKPGEGYRAYEEMLIYYAMQLLDARYGTALPPASLGEGKRVQRWINVGGQLVAGPDLDALLDDVESGVLDSWADVNRRLDQLWADYPQAKLKHAYQVLCELGQVQALDEEEWARYRRRYTQICQLVQDRIASSRQKDANNEFRQMTYWNPEEMHAVLGE